MATPLRVLILEDRPLDAELMVLELRRAGFDPQWTRVDTEQDFLANLSQEFDIILSDYSMPKFDALQALILLQGTGQNIPFIVVTGIFEADAIECMKEGAADYLIKDRLARLGPAVAQALEERELREEKQEVELALRESEARFRSVAEAALDALVVVDGDGRIGYWNPAVKEIFGYEDAELRGRLLALLFASEDADRYRIGMEAFAASGESPLLGKLEEFVGRRQDGTEFPMEVAFSSWEVSGRKFLSASIRDLSDAKEALRRAQLQDRLAAVGQLAAGIAHDFNNILGTIILYSELLLRQERLPEEENGRLTTMIQQAKRGAKLVSQVLDFSRRSVIERSAMDMTKLLKEVEELLSRTLPATIHLKLDFEGERFVINADPTRMQQVVMNLALNARDAMPDGGELTIRLDPFDFQPGQAIPFQGMHERGWARLRISDTGEGIKADDLPHVFEPFFTTKAPGKGTGLGLAQVYGIVKQHEGFIDVTSQRGEGTTFTIYLPASEVQAGLPLIDSRTQVAPGNGETILVVEDDEATRIAVADILESLQYRVICSSAGREAMEIYNRDPDEIDLILSDLVMPDLSGRALYEELSQKHEGVKILIMTGYPLGEDTRELLDRRTVDWMQKPFSSQTVARKVRDMLKQDARLAAPSG
ncbi:MAG: response regulator [Anaerolineales bacterium]